MKTLNSVEESVPGLIDVGPGPGPTGSPILDRLLDRERSRADRVGSPLALVVLKACEGTEAENFGEVLGETAASRIRLTDDMGWTADQQLFVILPHTDGDGAVAFARDLIGLLSVAGFGIDVETYCYAASSDAKGKAAAWTPVTVDRHKDRREDPREHTDGIGLSPAQVLQLEKRRRMEPLFARPLPLWKRIIDVAGSLFGLIVLSPILLLAALAVRLTSRGPIIFRQLRTGLGGVPFTIYKFRTMCVDAEQLQDKLKAISEQDGPAFKIKNDPRVTKIGKFLRVTSIDELPQLLNVLKGDMSLVGPRPLPVGQSAECAPWHTRRLDVTPGLTCTWQATARSMVTFDEWARMDARYARSRSLKGDVGIILQTIPAVLRRRGAQ